MCCLPSEFGVSSHEAPAGAFGERLRALRSLNRNHLLSGSCNSTESRTLPPLPKEEGTGRKRKDRFSLPSPVGRGAGGEGEGTGKQWSC